MSSGKKFDQGKSPVAQGVFAYFGKALTAVGEVSAKGAEKYNVKYSEQNWREVENAQGRYSDALARHFLADLQGNPIDEDTGLYHKAMVAWNALARLELWLSEDRAITKGVGELLDG